MNGNRVDERRTRRRPAQSMVAAAVDGALLFKCRLRDITEAGARLHGAPKAAPERFQLIDVAAGVAYSARVVWRRAPSAMGVAFLHARSVDDPATPEWLVKLWRELMADPDATSAGKAA